MRPYAFGWALAGLLLLVLPHPTVAQTGFTWWTDEKVIKDLALAPDQSSRIDAIFRATLAQLRQSKEELDRQESELSRLIEINSDETTVSRQVDKVESVRAGLNKTRTLMLLHMRQILTPKQNTKFKAVHEQWLRDHPRPPRTDEPKTRTETR
jgi:Spy/CpxP family protein refolding chaperone